MIKKHWIVGLAVLVVSLAVTVCVVQTTVPEYSASVTAVTNAQSAAADGSTSDSRMGVVSRVATSSAVLEPVIDELDLDTSVDAMASSVSASVDASGLMTVTATSSDSQQAADIANAVYDSLVQQIEDDSFASNETGLFNGLQFSVIERAVAPSSPVSPNKPRLIFMGTLAGLVLALVVIVVIDVSDKRVRDTADIQRILYSPVISSVPKSDTFRGTAPAVISDPSSKAAEDIRRLALNLDFIVPDKTDMSNVIVVASSDASEGKTTIAVNLAAAIAERGRTVLLIDTDLRKPSMAGVLGINGKVGLAHVLARQAKLDEAIQQYWKPTFHVMPAGEQQANPSILINSKAMNMLLHAAAKQYDNVIVDSTPMSVANDSAVFAKEGGTLLMVVGQGVAQKKTLKASAEEFELVGVKPAGAVVDMVKEQRGKGDYYYSDKAAKHSSQGTSEKSHEPTEKAEQ